ncbi:branched-chain amino acid ABC transporter ATP-binding protein/permease [Frigidibacter sp. SD6-1]|uniref:branched-chain amino acid ABC transporter ATP-binding protein/permease n=1 Tax=Frigidibacter sp. SD6-1 TaxID=3032581 RepID=UPI0024DFFDEC|nr:branched-chain amino acid ABC transporter ATP-binding protein/permease [Frigidibacter sp. SD6-1]
MRLWFALPRTAWLSAGLLSAALALVAFLMRALMGAGGDNIATLMLLQAAAVLALAVFSGNSGITSFGHSAFMGLGAYAAALMTMPAAVQKTALPGLPGWLQGHELGLLAALGVAALVGVIVGVASGAVMARLSTGSAAIGTLAFLIILHVCLVGARDITRGSQTFYGVPRLTGFGVALVAAVLFTFIARLFRESRVGLALRASRENEVAAAALGVSVGRMRLIGWALSITLACVAGALYGHYLGAFSPKDFYFDLTFLLIAMLIVGGRYSVTGALAGVVMLTAVVQILRQGEAGLDLGLFALPPVFGLPQLGLGLALLLTIWARPVGMVGLSELAPATFAPKLADPPPVAVAARRGARAARPLAICDVTVRFGGLAALEGVSFTVPTGQVTGLIGPNGAGKTTLVNVICGQQRPTSGAVLLDDLRLSELAPHEVARAGLARTFQNIRLFDRLTALENVTIAAQAAGHGRAEAEQLAMSELERVGLANRWNELAEAFAYGDRRRLEIARALALDPEFLLLDEPAAGMNPAETDRLIAMLEELRRERPIGILVIEHDMRLIMRLSDRMVVLNKGQKIAEGTPEAIRNDPAVIEAYIGTKRPDHNQRGEMK